MQKGAPQAVDETAEARPLATSDMLRHTTHSSSSANILKTTQTMRKQETRGAYLQRRSAQLRRKRWEGTMTEQEGIELDSVQHEILLRHVNRIHS